MSQGQIRSGQAQWKLQRGWFIRSSLVLWDCSSLTYHTKQQDVNHCCIKYTLHLYNTQVIAKGFEEIIPVQTGDIDSPYPDQHCNFFGRCIPNYIIISKPAISVMF